MHRFTCRVSPTLTLWTCFISLSATFVATDLTATQRINEMVARSGGWYQLLFHVRSKLAV